MKEQEPLKGIELRPNGSTRSIREIADEVRRIATEDPDRPFMLGKKTAALVHAELKRQDQEKRRTMLLSAPIDVSTEEERRQARNARRGDRKRAEKKLRQLHARH